MHATNRTKKGRIAKRYLTRTPKFTSQLCNFARNTERQKMTTLNQLVRNFLADEQGATAIEYGLLAGLISVVIIASITLIGSNLKGVFDVIVAKLTAVPRT